MIQSEEDTKAEIQKSFRLFDVDGTGFITVNNLQVDHYPSVINPTGRIYSG
jgi:hypothetical protein